MHRLTTRISCGISVTGVVITNKSRGWDYKAASRLADYEDTGLKPREIDKLNNYTAFRCVDDDHCVYRCGNCGELWKFEADGPFENGWNRCPKCGLLIKRPEVEDK